MSTENTADREIVNTRVVNATPGQVYTMWTDPNHLKNWWGPNGFTNTFHEFNPVPGGKWNFDMHGPDGKDYPNRIVFVELAPNRIVLDHLGEMHAFRIVATFDDLGGKTKVTFRMIFETVDDCDAVRAFAPQCNEQNFDRMEAELAKLV